MSHTRASIWNMSKVMELLDIYRPWLANMYANTMNVIHYMHDKYAYEKTQMALHDTDVHRYMAFGIAGMSVLADSLSAIKHAKVRCIRDEETGLITDYEITGSIRPLEMMTTGQTRLPASR